MMKSKTNLKYFFLLFILSVCYSSRSDCQAASIPLTKVKVAAVKISGYDKTVTPGFEIDVFLNENTWAQFDPDVGYILGNFAPHDGFTTAKLSPR